jgi:protoheme IX farnesyltransferase
MPRAVTLGPLLELTRPRVVALVVLTGAPVLRWNGTPWDRGAAVLAGTCLVAAACSAFNAWIERASDARMTRTANRPLPSGRLDPVAALAWGGALAVAGLTVLAATGGVGAVGIALATLGIYVGLYTAWLKPRSVHHTLVGSVAGATAPLIADAAQHGAPGFVGWVLFAIVFLWQPPHVWAIALFRAGEYAAAGIPMLPAVVGPRRARQHMLAWAVALVPVPLLLTPRLGWGYGAVVLAAGVWLAGEVAAATRTGADRRVFAVSLVYLHVVLGAMLVA